MELMRIQGKPDAILARYMGLSLAAPERVHLRYFLVEDFDRATQQISPTTEQGGIHEEA
jgi:hypothetical protein